MKLKVLVVDDETLARSRMRTLLADCKEPQALIGGEAGFAQEAMEKLQHEAFDVVLLDIAMPGVDGLSLAKVMQELPYPPAVIFVTAHAEHALQAFELEAVDYLTKPVRLERLQQALQKAERYIQSEIVLQGDSPEQCLVIQDRGRTERIALAEVIYLKAELKYVTVRTASKSYILDSSLNELEAQHEGYFLRIHRNALVARRSMRALEKCADPEEGEGWAVRLKGVDELLMVSRRQVTAVREAIAG